jgi:hypothetical protein
VLVLLLHDLDSELELGIVAVLDRFPQVLAVEVWILARDLLRLVPDERVDAQLRLPVEFDEAAFPSLLTSRKVWTPKPSIIR